MNINSRTVSLCLMFTNCSRARVVQPITRKRIRSKFLWTRITAYIAIPVLGEGRFHKRLLENSENETIYNMFSLASHLIV